MVTIDPKSLTAMLLLQLRDAAMLAMIVAPPSPGPLTSTGKTLFACRQEDGEPAYLALWRGPAVPCRALVGVYCSASLGFAYCRF